MKRIRIPREKFNEGAKVIRCRVEFTADSNNELVAEVEDSFVTYQFERVYAAIVEPIKPVKKARKPRTSKAKVKNES